MQCFAREGYQLWKLENIFGVTNWNSRYSFDIGALSTIFWFGVAYKLYTSNRKIYSLLLSLLIIYHTVYYTNIRLHTRQDIHWSEYANNLDKVRKDMRNKKLASEHEMPPLPLHPQKWRDVKLLIKYPF